MWFRHNPRRALDGTPLPAEPCDKFEAITDIQPGIYVIKRKTLSLNIRDEVGSTLKAGLNAEGKYTYGDIFDSYLEVTQRERKTYSYQHRTEKTNQVIEIDPVIKSGYLGPVIWDGQPNMISNRNQPDRYARRPTTRLVVDVFIPSEAIFDAPNGIYYQQELDLVLSSTIDPIRLVHPDSPQGKRQERKAIIAQRLSKVGSSIQVVNVNNNKLKPAGIYYCNLGGVIIGCKPIVSPLYDDTRAKDGLYIYIKEDNANVAEYYLSYEDAINHTDERLPAFFLSQDQARCLGNADTLHKNREREREAEYKKRIAEMELKYRQQTAEREAAYKERINKIDEEAKQRANEQKQRSEDHHYSRKEQYDDFKLQILLSTAVITAVTAALHYFSRSGK